MLSVIAGHDPADSTSAPRPVPDYAASLERGVKGLKLGVPRPSSSWRAWTPRWRPRSRRPWPSWTSLGAELVPVSLPHTDHALAVYYIIAPAEASSNLARYDGVKYGLSLYAREGAGLMDMYLDTRSEGFGDGGYPPGHAGHLRPERGLLRRLLRQGRARCAPWCAATLTRPSSQVDAIVGPVTPTPAFDLGQKVDDPLQMYLSDVFTLSTNLAGLPGMSIPAGFSQAGRPIGLQIIGPHFAEETLFAVGHAYEQATDHHLRRPPL